VHIKGVKVMVEREKLWVHVYLYVLKVKLSLYRPGHALRAVGGWGIQDFWTMGTWRWQGCHPYALVTFTPKVLVSVRGGVNARAIVWPEGLSQWKIPFTLSGIKPGTFWLLAHCLNHLYHRVPHMHLLGVLKVALQSLYLLLRETLLQPPAESDIEAPHFRNCSYYCRQCLLLPTVASKKAEYKWK
jgi:hypothetical protein